MKASAAEIAALVDGRVEGDASVVLTGFAGLDEAGEGDLSFLSNPRYTARVADTRAAAVIVGEDWRGTCRGTLIRVGNPDLAFAAVARELGPRPPVPPPGIHAAAVVDPAAKLDADVAVGPCAVVEAGVTIGARSVIGAGCYLGRDARVGCDCRLYPQVSVRENVVMGDRVIVHNGAVVGSDGFGYVRDGERWEKVPQIGTVEIGDDVEIGANATVDRARFGKTVIGNGVKIDNLVQIAHNVRIGDNTAIAALAGIAGSTVIGRNVQIGGQAGTAGHLTIHDNAIVAAQSGVSKDVPAGSVVFGCPAAPMDKVKRARAHVMRLPKLRQELQELEERLSRLERDS